MKYISKYNSPIGIITMLSDGTNLTNLWIHGQPEVKGKFIEKYDLDVFDKTRNWLKEYFIGKEPQIKIPLKLKGTEFRKMVWNYLLQIPYGKTVTYKDIAILVAKEKNINKMSAQAIGGAVGHNPISIIVPCHRVIGTNGELTGYAGGIHFKKELLKIEKIL